MNSEKYFSKCYKIQFSDIKTSASNIQQWLNFTIRGWAACKIQILTAFLATIPTLHITVKQDVCDEVITSPCCSTSGFQSLWLMSERSRQHGILWGMIHARLCSTIWFKQTIWDMFIVLHYMFGVTLALVVLYLNSHSLKKCSYILYFKFSSL